MRILVLVLAALTLAGCLHSVSFDERSQANWHAAPSAKDVKAP